MLKVKLKLCAGYYFPPSPSDSANRLKTRTEASSLCEHWSESTCLSWVELVSFEHQDFDQIYGIGAELPPESPPLSRVICEDGVLSYPDHPAGLILLYY